MSETYPQRHSEQYFTSYRDAEGVEQFIFWEILLERNSYGDWVFYKLPEKKFMSARTKKECLEHMDIITRGLHRKAVR